jgi:predicted  nucleic acid-binding Zn-ribbon protein
MEKNLQRLRNIDKAINKIAGHLAHTEIENNNLKNQIRELNNTIAGQEDQITKLREQMKLLEVSRSVETGKGSIEAKAKINELVREIDKCIGLLNS